MTPWPMGADRTGHPTSWPVVLNSVLLRWCVLCLFRLHHPSWGGQPGFASLVRSYGATKLNSTDSPASQQKTGTRFFAESPPTHTS
ncbi:hypothetical protein LZ31DRAFT_557929 [Colletotrichum somersetense]|nr:hypothetical protein LZ31DRAFT_557929 [Colletotrichum somersetense]